MDIDSVPTYDERFSRNLFLGHVFCFVTGTLVFVRYHNWWFSPNLLFAVYFSAYNFRLWRKLRREREDRRVSFKAWRERISNPPSLPSSRGGGLW